MSEQQFSNRYKEIVRVMVKYGFNTWISNTPLSVLIPKKVVEREKHIMELPPETRLRMAVEELGPTFIKLGQMLSNRPDLFPRSYIKEMKLLQDSVQPDPTLVSSEIINEQQGKPLSELFDEISVEPLAVASIGQTYTASLEDKKVVVKIQKPAASAMIEGDLKIIKNIVKIIAAYNKDVASKRPLSLFMEFEKGLRNELDYRNEATNQQRFINNFKDDPYITAPHIYHRLTEEKMLCMDFAEGVKMNDYIQNGDPEEKKIVAERVINSFFKQIVMHGFFHSDPHPGNIFVTEDLRVCYIDFGLMGTLLPADRATIGRFLDAFLNRKTQKVIEYVEELASSHSITAENRKELEYRIYEVFQYLDRDMKQVEWGAFREELQKIVSDYDIILPSYFVNIVRCLGIILGVCMQLDPEVNITETLKPFLKDFFKQSLSGSNFLEALKDSLFELQTLKDIPTMVRDFAKNFKDGVIHINITIDDQETIMDNFKDISNRLVLGLIIGSLLIGSSTVVATESTSEFINNISMGGYISAGILGVMLAYNVFRESFSKDKRKKR